MDGVHQRLSHSLELSDDAPEIRRVDGIKTEMNMENIKLLRVVGYPQWIEHDWWPPATRIAAPSWKRIRKPHDAIPPFRIADMPHVDMVLGHRCDADHRPHAPSHVDPPVHFDGHERSVAAECGEDGTEEGGADTLTESRSPGDQLAPDLVALCPHEAEPRLDFSIRYADARRNSLPGRLVRERARLVDAAVVGLADLSAEDGADQRHDQSSDQCGDAAGGQ